MRMKIPLRYWLGLALGLVILNGCTSSDSYEPPAVDISEPSAGSSLSGIVMIRVSATDDGRVTEVRLYVDDQLVGADTTKPFEFAWDTRTVSNGDHRISAIAKDDDGKESEDDDTIVGVDNSVADTTAPTVDITAPAADSTVSGSSVVIAAAASDDIAVAGVEFFLDGAPIGSDDSSPFSIVWDSNVATNASHELSARATDTSGNPSADHSITITVDNALAHALWNQVDWDEFDWE